MEKVNSFASSRQTYLKCFLSALGIYLMHFFRLSSFLFLSLHYLHVSPSCPHAYLLTFPPFLLFPGESPLCIFFPSSPTPLFPSTVFFARMNI